MTLANKKCQCGHFLLFSATFGRGLSQAGLAVERKARKIVLGRFFFLYLRPPPQKGSPSKVQSRLAAHTQE